jgi:hypothetical protein
VCRLIEQMSARIEELQADEEIVAGRSRCWFAILLKPRPADCLANFGGNPRWNLKYLLSALLL